MLTLEQRPDGWWIIGQPRGDLECGPYTTKTEAKTDLRGVERFYKQSHDRAFILGSDEARTLTPKSQSPKQSKNLFQQAFEASLKKGKL